MIKANLKKDYPLISKNFVIFTSIEEYLEVSRIVNRSNCSSASLNLKNIAINKVKDFKELAILTCQQYSIESFRLNELFYFLHKNFDFKEGPYIYIGPEGIFESREEYHKWQQLYGLLKPITKDN